MEKKEFYQLSFQEAAIELKTDLYTGIDKPEAQNRFALYGPNELTASARVSPWVLFFSQFKNILIQILLSATLLSAFLGHAVESIAIAVIVLFAVILSFVQEYRAERAIEALKRMAAPTANVIRGKEEEKIPARELVPGDIILIKAGDKIPADSRVAQSFNLQVEEAALTGESVAVEKKIDALTSGDLGLGDRNNMVYSGTIVSYGRGRAMVTATGMNTEFGKITGMLQEVKTAKTPLQINLDHVGKNLAKAAGVIVVIIVALGVFRGQPFLEMVIFGIALAVAVVPEALPAVVTISLAIGVQRMVKRNALIRRLPIVETLGCTSVICSDKTGTLTKDEMTIRKIFVSGQFYDVDGAGYDPAGGFSIKGAPVKPTEDLAALLRAATLASDARLIKEEGRWDIKGDPTEGALIVAAAKAGLDKTSLEKDNPRINEIPFSSESKRMTTLCEEKGAQVAYSKGADEVILNNCGLYLREGKAELLDARLKSEFLNASAEMAKQALRVLAVAYKPNTKIEDAEKNMIFLGFVGMIDPPRPEAKVAVQNCRDSGIKPVMITGDHPLTAQAIARELGILQKGRVVTGIELDRISDADLERDIEGIDVYARVSPAHKLRVVAAFQKRGHVVAMTGDGVNDAPALKKADVGIAMGITGTDVTKEVAAMTLTDDNFASIVAAVEEGRHIFGNIKKYLMYLISSNIGEIGLMAGATLLGMPIPLTAVQILYVNLATDGLPALALAVDPPEADLMRRKPRHQSSGIFTRPVVILMIVGGIWSTLVNIGIFAWALKSGMSLKEAMTMTFVSLVLIQFFKAYNYRSDRQSIMRRPFANKWLNMSVLWELILLILIVYLPFLHKPFGTFSLPLLDWVIVVAVSITVIPVLEIVKWMIRKGLLGSAV
ncbi:MAG: cation-translocating P-type ATPase [Candidatus Omnitrophica bacterium]|nr:cation-translocating P-type ATPase [Candidatus Omnitrophota bacterium]